MKLKRWPSRADDGAMRRPLPRGRGSRGATLVEYALLVALLVVPSIGALSRINHSSGDYYSSASDDIGDLPQTGIDTSTNSSAPASSSSTTSTTLPPTTTTSTSTTLAPTTTTSTSTTTTSTTMPLRSRISQLTDISTNSGSSYNAIARVKIVRNTNGTAVNGASVTIRMVNSAGTTTTKTCSTDSTGRCSVTWSVADYRSPVTATVTNVTATPIWDGVQGSVLLYSP